VTQLCVEQCRAARVLLDWSQASFGAKAQVSEGTVRDFEKSKRVPAGDILVAMRSALELAGVAFLRDGEMIDGGPGDRLRRRARISRMAKRALFRTARSSCLRS
jgi:transcriptional regulator with XRE-family HTH domain